MATTEKKPTTTQKRAVEFPPHLTVGQLGEILSQTPVEVIKELMRQGHMLSINEEVGLDIARKVALRFGVAIKKPREREKSTATQVDTGVTNKSNLKPRPPIITITGHVDHGKTTLLDAIQGSKLVKREKGGITQSIGAYPVVHKGKQITVFDTPGHAAFTAMRASGIRVTDITVLVVAADDGVKPQTIEAIDHAKAANVPIVVAINKCDLPQSDPDQIKFQLTQHGITVEELGGDTLSVKISALKGTGIDALMEAILLVAELNEIKADWERSATGVVFESKLDRKKGVLVSVILSAGVLKVGNTFIMGEVRGKVKSMTDGVDNQLKTASPGMAVQIMGVTSLPTLGAKFEVVENDQAAKQLIEMRKNFAKGKRLSGVSTTMDDFKRDIANKDLRVVEIVLKAGTRGELDAAERALKSLKLESASLSVIHAGTGAVNESDVLLASTAGKTVVVFNATIGGGAKKQAERLGVRVLVNEIIYSLLDEIEKIVEEIVAPKEDSNILGMALVQALFPHGKKHKIAGIMVKEGVLKPGVVVKVVREEEEIFRGKIKNMRHLRNEVNLLEKGTEGGVILNGFDDMKPGDEIISEKQGRN